MNHRLISYLDASRSPRRECARTEYYKELWSRIIAPTLDSLKVPLHNLTFMAHYSQHKLPIVVVEDGISTIVMDQNFSEFMYICNVLMYSKELKDRICEAFLFKFVAEEMRQRNEFRVYLVGLALAYLSSMSVLTATYEVDRDRMAKLTRIQELYIVFHEIFHCLPHLGQVELFSSYLAKIRGLMGNNPVGHLGDTEVEELAADLFAMETTTVAARGNKTRGADREVDYELLDTIVAISLCSTSMRYLYSLFSEESEGKSNEHAFEYFRYSLADQCFGEQYKQALGLAYNEQSLTRACALLPIKREGRDVKHADYWNRVRELTQERSYEVILDRMTDAVDHVGDGKTCFAILKSFNLEWNDESGIIDKGDELWRTMTDVTNTLFERLPVIRGFP